MIVKALRAPLASLLSVLLLVMATLVGFAARTPGWTAADTSVGDSIQAVRTPWLTAVALVLNVGFGTIVGTVLVAALTVALAVSGRRRAAGVTLLVIVAGWGMSTVVKAIVARPRPPIAHDLVREIGNDSFPSGHVALTLSIVIAVVLLARRTPYFRPVVAAGCLLVVAQMLARVYLGAHYPTDVLGSIVVTPAAILLVITGKRLFVLLLRADDRRRARRAVGRG